MARGAAKEFDFEKFRLRRFVDRLIDANLVEIRNEAVPLTGLSPIIEASDKAVLFRRAGPQGLEIVANAGAGRPQLETAQPRGELGLGGQDQHGHARATLPRLQHLIAVSLGQPHVEDHEVEAPAEQVLETLGLRTAPSATSPERDEVISRPGFAVPGRE